MGKSTASVVIATIALICFAGAVSPVSANQSRQPSWFPNISCADAWNVRDGRPYVFNYSKFGLHETSQIGERYQNFVKSSLRANPVPRIDCYKKWTILIVMDADNDLMPYSLWDLYEMETSYAQLVNGSTFRKDVLVQHHGRNQNTVRRFHIFQSPRSYEPQLTRSEFLRGGRYGKIESVHSPVVQAVSTQTESFDEKVERFVDFVKWGVKNYPAEHYMIIYWGHGKGWMVQEEESLAHLTGPELREALKSIYNDSDGLQGKRKIDNFVADACYMQSLELLTEVSPYARFVSGSAEVQSFLGLPYRTLFSEMDKGYRPLAKKSRHLPQDKVVPWRSKEREDEPKLVAKLLPVLVARHLSKNGFGGRIDRAAIAAGDSSYGDLQRFTFSSVDTAALQIKLIPELNNFGLAALRYLVSEKDQIREKANVMLDQLWLAPSFRSKNESREVGSLLHLWSGFNSEMNLQIRRVDSALNETVVLSLQGKKYDNPNLFQSLNVWFPKRSRNFELEYREFDELEGYELDKTRVNIFGNPESYWRRFINGLMRAAG